MGTIIILIIIFIIVASVIKRFQELSKSGEKIQRPRTGNEPVYRETMKETVYQETMPEPILIEKTDDEAGDEEYHIPKYLKEETEEKPFLERHSRTLDEILGKMKADLPKEESYYPAQREIVTDSTQESIYLAPRGIADDSRQEGSSFKGKTAEEFLYGRKRGVMPQFGYNAVVKGLVMSEILGRPVSMKRANDWW